MYGPTALHDTAVSYGLAQPTGIPHRQRGRRLHPRRGHRGRAPQGSPPLLHGQWLAGDSVSAAVGQGDVLVTPLQLANAYATFANHGTVYQPQVVARILKPGGDPDQARPIVLTVKPVVTGHVDLPPTCTTRSCQGCRAS